MQTLNLSLDVFSNWRFNNFVLKPTNGFPYFATPNPSPGTDGSLIPGDPEREAEEIWSKEGIALLKPVVDDLLDISKKMGTPFAAK